MAAWANGMQLGPYVLIALIGAGGMGEVWKARDTRLNRIVAIKRLKGRHTSRFEQEARAIAALNHPNICQIYDVGPDYLVMEYIDGKPLSGPLADDEAVRLALQIAGALEEAHGKKILHRDLKPGNILVTVKGAAKVLDFGLAKFMADSDATNTIEGTVLGTAAYMSPEQAQGMAVDERSDIFSFGAVLYEVLSGRRAFAGSSMAEVLIAVLRGEPAPLQPGRAADVVKRCLAKEPEQRFQSAVEVTAALERIGTRPEEQQPSIAVLPFANMSADKEQEYFSDGLAEEIINALAQIQGLKVIARTSSFAFRGKDLDVRKIAEALDVRAILEGSVRKAGNRIRVTAQLIGATDGSHLWSERYDREMTDVFAVQDEISQAIVDTLKLKLIPGKPVATGHAPNVEAYQAYLRGRHHLYPGSPEAIDRAKACFEEAIALDPHYAQAHAGLAECYVHIAMEQSSKSARELMPLAKAAALKAVELDGTKPEGHIWLARVAAQYDYDWTEALRQYRLALACGGVAPRERASSVIFILTPLGRLDEAIASAQEAVTADPLAAMPRAALAFALQAGGSHQSAIAELRRLIELHENYWLAYLYLGLNYTTLDMTSEAIAALEKAFQLAPWHGAAIAFLAWNYIRFGDRARAEDLLARTPAGSARDSVFYLLSSDFERSAAEFEKEIEARRPNAILLKCVPIFRSFCETPRGRALLQKMNSPAERPHS